MITKRASCSRTSLTDDSDENSPVAKRSSLSRKKFYRKWTKEEDERLLEFIRCHDDTKDWSRISKYVGTDRTDAQCQHRWDRFLDPSITKGPWTDEEDRRVVELVHQYGARQWSLIAKELKGRVGKQCRERWHNHLNPSINKEPWTNDESLRLFVLHQHFGNKWAEIARYFNGRSDNSIKNHWNSSLKKKFHLEVENLQKQGLEWTKLIPSDFTWPKLEKPAAVLTTRSSRVPLRPITNRVSRSRSSNKMSPVTKIENSDNHPPANRSHFDVQEYRSAEDLERLFYRTPPSPTQQLPMLSSTANDTPLFHSYPFYATAKPLHGSFFHDESFSIKAHEYGIGDGSSPPHYHVLNTPERARSPSLKQDCFDEYLLLPEPTDGNDDESVEKFGYHPTYQEVLLGQTRDQRHITEKARRYLSCSLPNDGSTGSTAR